MDIVSSGDSAMTVEGTDWEELLTVPGMKIVDYIVVINEGDWAGSWRLVGPEGQETTPARLPVGGGDPGERRASFTVPCRGFSGGCLQVKRALGGGHLSGLFAFGGRT